MKMFYEKDADVELIKGKKIAIFGYGSQGHAHALNLKDSGVKEIVVALREGSSSVAKAESKGLKVMTLSDAAAWADVVMILTPDELQAEIYKNHIEQRVREGTSIAFAHGLNVHYDLIKARKDLDVFMVAPKGPGSKVRETYLDNFGTPSIVAVEQDFTGKAWDRTLGIAKAIGSARAGLIKTAFKEEVETDWFGEQADLCGGAASMVTNAFETLVEGGYQPEIAYFEVLHELKLIVDMIQRYGINGMWRRVSETARYGGLTRGPMVMDAASKDNMKKVLTMIQDGTFNKEWISEYQSKGSEAFDQYMKKNDEHQIEKVGKEMRKMMWPDSTE